MRRPLLFPLGLALLVVGVAEATPTSGPSVVLRSRRLPGSITGMARELPGRLPAYGMSAKVDGVRYYFLDLDHDGELTPGDADGIAREDEPFVVPLPAELATRRAQYDLAFESRWLVLTPQELELDEELLETLDTINRMRFNGARAPLAIDPAARRKTQLHVRYVVDNGLHRRAVSHGIHRQDPRNPSYTPEGAVAARHGLVGLTGTLERDARAWYSSVYHAARLLDPRVRHLGLAHEDGVSVLLPVDDPTPIARIEVHPSDGARRIPLEFAPGGVIPDPIPGPGTGSGAGYPVVVMLPDELQDAELLEFELRDGRHGVVEGYLSTPTNPANQVYPRNFGCLFFIPCKKLAPRTSYRARVRFRGMEAPLEWSFETTE